MNCLPHPEHLNYSVVFVGFMLLSAYLSEYSCVEHTCPILWLFYSCVEHTCPVLWLLYSCVEHTFPVLWLLYCCVEHTCPVLWLLYSCVEHTCPVLWLWYYLYFELRFLITHLVSAKFSYRVSNLS